MAKVYIVTEGAYSDYHIEAVFDTREAARAFIGNCSSVHIEEYELNETGGRMFREQWACVIGLSEGNMAVWRSICVLTDKRKRGYVDFDLYSYSNHPTFRGQFTATAHSFISQEHANKLAFEARQAWLRAGRPEKMDPIQEEEI